MEGQGVIPPPSAGGLSTGTGRSVTSEGTAIQMEMEHAIGYTGLRSSVHVAPGSTKYFFVAGGCIVIGNYADPHDQTFVRGHDDDITCMHLSDSGNFLITGQRGHNADVCVWSTDTMRPVHRFPEHEKSVLQACISPDDTMVASIGEEWSVNFFDMSNGGLITHISLIPLVAPSDTINDATLGCRVQDVKRRQLDFYHFCVVSTTQVMAYYVDPYKASLNPLKLNLTSFARKYLSCRYSAAGDLLLIGSEAGDVAIISTQYGTIATTVRLCSVGIREIAVVRTENDGKPRDLATQGDFKYARFGPGSERSTTFFVGGGDGLIVGCEIPDHANISVNVISKSQLDSGVTSLSIVGASYEGHTVIAATSRGLMSLVNCVTSDKAKLQQTQGFSVSTQKRDIIGKAPPQNTMGSVAARNFTATQTVLNDPNIKKISDAVPAPYDVITPHPSAPERFVTASQDGLLRLWDLNDYTIVGTFETSVKEEASVIRCSEICVSEGLEIMLSSWSDGAVRCHDLTNFSLLWVHARAHRSPITALCLSPSMKYYVTGSNEGEIKMWDIRSRELKGELKDHKQAIISLKLFDDDKHLLSGSKDRSVIAWDLATMRRVSFLECHAGPLTSILLCRNQCNVYTASVDHTMAMWDLRQKEAVRKISYAPQGSEAYCTTLCRNMDERLLATGGTDQIVQLWDERVLKPVNAGYGHSGTVVQTAFTADSRQVLSAGLDACVMVWNVYQ